MNLEAQKIDLELAQPFRIAHGISATRESLLVRLDGGIGEGALPPYYPSRPEECLVWLRHLDAARIIGDSPALDMQLDHIPDGPAAAITAVEIALHDRWAKALGQPLWRVWGLDPGRAPLSTFTLGIPESEAQFLAELDAVRTLPLLKLKLGSGNLDFDEWLVRTATGRTGAKVCADANGGWSPAEAAAILPRLTGHCIYVEQPVPVHGLDPWRELRSRLAAPAPPLFADESAQSKTDIQCLRGLADGVNIKLLKTHGLREARSWIKLARTLNMQVMIGTMIESAVGCTAAAQLAPLADFADVDAVLLVKNSPFRGIRLEQGRILYPAGNGLGLAPAA